MDLKLHMGMDLYPGNYPERLVKKYMEHHLYCQMVLHNVISDYHQISQPTADAPSTAALLPSRPLKRNFALPLNIFSTCSS